LTKISRTGPIDPISPIDATCAVKIDEDDIATSSYNKDGVALGNSSVKFCGKQVGDTNAVPIKVCTPCYYLPAPALRAANMEKNAMKKTPMFVPPTLQELEQAKSKLRSIIKSEPKTPVVEKEFIETLLKSCHEIKIQNDEKISEIPVKNQQLNLRFEKIFNKNNPNLKLNFDATVIDNREFAETLLKSCLMKSVEVVNQILANPDEVTDEEIIEIPVKKQYVDLHFKKISNKNNPNSDLRCADMNMTTIDNCDFSNSDMRCAQMKCMTIKDTNMSGVDFTGAELKQSVFKRVNFTDAKLCNLNCDNLKFKNCIFTGADITYSSFAKANLRGTKLTDNDLSGCCFMGADLIDTGITEDVASLYPGVNFKSARIGFRCL